MPHCNKLVFIFLTTISLFLCGQLQSANISIVYADQTESLAVFLRETLEVDDNKVISVASIEELSKQSSAAETDPLLMSQLDLLKLQTLPALEGSDFLIFIEREYTTSTAIIFDLKSHCIIGMLPLPNGRRAPKDDNRDIIRDAVLFRINIFENRARKSERILLMPTYVEGVDETAGQAFDLLLAARLETMTGIPVVKTERLNRYSKTQLSNFIKTTPDKLIRIRGEILLNQDDGSRTARFAINEGESSTQVYEVSELTDHPKEWAGPICEQLNTAALPTNPINITSQQTSRYFDCMARLAFVFRPFENDSISYASSYALAAQWLGADDIVLRRILLIEDTSQMTRNRTRLGRPELNSEPGRSSYQNATMRETLNSVYTYGYDRKVGNQIYWTWFPGSLTRAERIAENYAFWIDSIKTNKELFEQDLQWEMGYRVLLSLAMPLIASSQGLQHDEWFEPSQKLFTIIDRYYDALNELELTSTYSGALLSVKTGLLAVENREADQLFNALDQHFQWEEYEPEAHAYLQRGFLLINGITGFFTSAGQFDGLNRFVDSRSQSSLPQDKALCAAFGYYKDSNREPRLQQLENFFNAIGSMASSDKYSAETINQYMSDFKELTGIDGQYSISIPDENSSQSGASINAVWHYEASLRVRLLYQNLKDGYSIHQLKMRKEGGLYGRLPRISTRSTGTGETFTNIDAVKKALDPFYELLLQYKADTSVSPERIDFLKSFLSPVVSSHSDLRESYSEVLNTNSKIQNRSKREEPQTLKAKRIWSSEQALSPPGDPEQIRLMSCFIRPSGNDYFAIMDERIKVEAEVPPTFPMINEVQAYRQLPLEPQEKTIRKIVRINRDTGEFTAVECPEPIGTTHSQIFGWKDSVLLLSKDQKGMLYDFKENTWLPLDFAPNSTNYFQYKDKVYLSHGTTLSRFSLSSKSLIPFSESIIEDLKVWSAQKYHKFEIESTGANNLLICGFPTEHTGAPPVKLTYDIETDSWSGLPGIDSMTQYRSGPYTGPIPYRIMLHRNTFNISLIKQTPESARIRKMYQFEFEGLGNSPTFGTVTYEFESPYLYIISSGIRTSGIWRIKMEEDMYE